MPYFVETNTMTSAGAYSLWAITETISHSVLALLKLYDLFENAYILLSLVAATMNNP